MTQQHSDTPRAEHPSPDAGPRVTRDEVKDVGRMRRTTTDRHIAGVAGGLARHLDVDPIIVRVGLVVAVFFGGAGLLLYGAAWLLVPEEGTSSQPLGLDERSRVFALLGAGVLAVLAAVGDWTGAFWFPWPFAIVALGVLWFFSRSSSRAAPNAGQPAVPNAGDPAVPYAGDPAVPNAGQPAVPYTGQPAVPYAGQPADPTVHARPPRQRNPRRRGPVLLWFTLALIALAEGVLGVVDVAGVDVTPSAYPALALAVTTTMLLLGSFWGRAGGLILVGIVAALATVATSAGNEWSTDTVRHTPTSAAAVQDLYDLRPGATVIDLSQVDDVENLDGRSVDVDAVAGRVEVIVPDGVDVSVETSVVGGDARVFDRRRDGGDVGLTGFVDGGPQAPDLSVSIDMLFGEILVRTP